MLNFRVVLLLSVLLITAHNCYAENNVQITAQNTLNVGSTDNKDTLTLQKDESVDEKDNDDVLVNILNDAMEAQEDFSKTNPATTSFSDNDIAIKKVILTRRNNSTGAPISIDEQKDAQNSKLAKLDVNYDKNDQEEILGSTAGTNISQKISNKFNIDNALSRQEQVDIATLTTKAVQNFDFEGIVNTFKSAHNNYKQDVEDATKLGTALRWQDKGLLGAKHYGGAYAKVMFTIASETIKVAGPKLAMMLLTALIAA